jgi:hypothetical protein
MIHVSASRKRLSEILPSDGEGEFGNLVIQQDESVQILARKKVSIGSKEAVLINVGYWMVGGGIAIRLQG